jgi:hypothetical protein
MLRFLSAAVAIGACLALGVWVLRAGESGEQQGAFRALIVPVRPIERDGIGRCEAWRVADKKAVARLESFFPQYRTRPARPVAGGWEAVWDVYFDLPNKETICVTVSDANEAAWSTGHGDLKVRGDFYGFVEELRKRSAGK